MTLTEQLIKEGYIKSANIIAAFKKIKRQDFLREAERPLAEVNAPLAIGFGQTISQPLTVAFMLELLQPQAGEKILDVGSGSGWTVALLSQIVGSAGRVYGLELVPELRDFAERNVAKYNFIDKKRAAIINADGYAGLPRLAPFDKIIVAAAAPQIPPALVRQLKIGGRLVMPVGPEGQAQEIVLLNKISDQKFKSKSYPGFIFVPLVKKNL